jgi:hypothetical protein
MQGNEGVVGESTATVWGGGFISIASNPFRNRYNFFDEAGDLRHG